MLTYENLWFDPTDDSKNVKQLKDAKDIVTRLGMVTDRYKNIERNYREIIDCICTSIYLDDEEIDKEIAKAQAPIEKYQITYAKFKKDYGKIVDKVYNCIRFNTETNSKYPTNKKEETKNNSETCKNQTVTHSNRSIIKDIEEYSEEEDDETEEENSDPEESYETENESEENEDVGEQTDEDDKVKCKVDYGMEGHEDIRVAKKVTCRYFKKSHKNVRIPDTYCRKKLRSPQEMITHVKQDHPWYIVTI